LKRTSTNTIKPSIFDIQRGEGRKGHDN